MILTLTDLPLYHLFPRPSRVTQRHIYLFALSQPQPQKLRENHRRSRGANHALAFSSSMAAIEAIIQGLASVSHIVYMASLYGGTHRYLKQVALSFDCTVTLVNDIQTELGNILDNCKNTVKMVWIETPSNPTLWLADIQAVTDIANKSGSLLVVDNTVLSPYIQNPLRYGADVVYMR